jgi:ribonucleoside-diphosphate reductase alpha chain
MAYRDEKAAMRRRRPVSASTRAAFDEAATYFPTALQQFQFFDKYSRFNYALGRRETWVETVDRAVDFLVELTEATTGQRRGEVVEWLRGDGREMMLRMEALPSMRLLAMAGEPARRQNLAIYNCSYIAVDNPQAWVEMLIISMSGCGVGFSVERKYIDKLPSVAMQTGRYIDHVVDDSTEGWAEALRLGLQSWFVDGVDVRYDFNQVRHAGAPLKTKGGRASGPDPLRIMLLSIRNIILSRQGQRLRDTDAHTISCHVGQAAVQGGMRRTAMISLSDADSTGMARIKQGNYDPVLWNANNSSVWHDGVDDVTILRHFVEMDEGKNGERGIFSRDAAMATMPERRRALWPDGVGAGTNPCIVGDTLVYLADGRGARSD